MRTQMNALADQANAALINAHPPDSGKGWYSC